MKLNSKLKKVLLVTEYLNPPYDEGIKKTVYNLFLDLDKRYDLQVICRFGFEKDNIHIVQANRLYFSKKIKDLINDFNPDSLIYLPFQSSTFASYMRLRVLSFFIKNNNSIFICLQPKPIKIWQKNIIQLLKPKIALTPSPALNKFWNSINIDSELIPLLTDLKVFKSIESTTSKKELREKYGLPIDKFIVSHMGHLNEGRNLKSLIPIQKSNVQIVIVGSSSTPIDAKGLKSLKDELINSGIIIIENYIDHIEEVYQLSDAYIFPVVKNNSSIGMPLSILEARACAIPVITTDYGSIKMYMAEDYGGIKYTNQDDFLKSLNHFKNSDQSFSKTNVPSLNDMFYNIIHKKIQDK